MRLAVDVWCLPLADAAPVPESDLRLLSDDERQRFAGYLVPGPARMFASTRLALRRLLAARLGRRPEDIVLEPDENGKPRVTGSASTFFNVTHCADRALIAFCDDAPVGVDIELASALAATEALADLVCSAPERALLGGDATESARALTRLWVRKEAVLKATGRGLRLPPARLNLGDFRATEGAVEDGVEDRVAWCDLALPPGHVGAVALLSRDAVSIDVGLRLHAA